MATPGFNYIIRCGPYYKIGRSSNVGRRMVQLEVQMPHPIEVIAVIPVNDMVRAERELHSIYAERRLNGEWFDLSPESVEWWQTWAKTELARIEAERTYP